MFRASVTFFVLGLLSMIFSINHIAGLSIIMGQVLLGVFMILSVLSLLVGKTTPFKRVPHKLKAY